MAKAATKSTTEDETRNPFEPKVPMAEGPFPFQAHVAKPVDPNAPTPTPQTTSKPKQADKDVSEDEPQEVTE